MAVSITTNLNHTYRVTAVIPNPDGERVYPDDDNFPEHAQRAVLGGMFVAERGGTEMLVPGREVRQLTFFPDRLTVEE